MTKEEIINAYIKIRMENHTIPDDVLDYMKYAALEKLSKEVNQEQPTERYLKDCIKEYPDGWYITFLALNKTRIKSHGPYKTKGIADNDREVLNNQFKATK